MVNIFFLDENPEKCAKYYHDKQVNIMFTEISMILTRIHNYFDENINFKYNKKSININLNICKWIMESQENYIYCSKLCYALMEEYKYRNNKDSCPNEEQIKWLCENIPQKIPNIEATPFKLSKNVESYHIAFNNILDACIYSYVDYKLQKKRKWTKSNEPEFFVNYLKKSEKIKENELKKINKLLKNNINKHIILDECYKKMLGKNYKKNNFMYKKMFDFNKDLLFQLGCGHLIHLRNIIEETL